MRNTLAVNIMEAVLEDERLENINNAETGAVLARYVHTEEHNNRTGSELQRANLYSAWNLAFVSHFPDFVFYLPKLLIPSVSNYQDNPQSYIYIRVLALNTYIHWKMNWNSNNNNEKIQWMDSSLTKDFGEANKISKEDYIGKLATAMSTTTAMIEAKPRPKFSPWP